MSLRKKPSAAAAKAAKSSLVYSNNKIDDKKTRDEEVPIEVVNTASSVVSKWMSNMMGITSDDREEDSYDSIMKQAPTEDEQKVLEMQQPRAKRLGLGAKFVPHHGGILPTDPLSKKLKRKIDNDKREDDIVEGTKRDDFADEDSKTAMVGRSMKKKRLDPASFKPSAPIKKETAASNDDAKTNKKTSNPTAIALRLIAEENKRKGKKNVEVPTVPETTVVASTAEITTTTATVVIEKKKKNKKKNKKNPTSTEATTNTAATTSTATSTITASVNTNATESTSTTITTKTTTTTTVTEQETTSNDAVDNTPTSGNGEEKKKKKRKRNKKKQNSQANDQQQ